MRGTGPSRGRLPRTADAIGYAAVSVLIAAGLALVPATPAWAHTGGGAEPSNYRVTVTSVPSPVAVQVGVGGQWVRVRLTDEAAGRVEVLGYRGEPFLRISADGVRVNERSTVSRDNPRLASRGQADGGQADGGQADGGQADGGRDTPAGPRWTSVGPDRTAAWFDDRTSTGAGRWRLPLRIDGVPAEITGVRGHVPPPSPWPWVGGLLLVAAAVAALGWRTRWHWPAAGVLIVAGLASAAHLAGAALTPGPGSTTSVWLSALFTGALCWPIAAIAVVLVLRRREHAPFAVAVAGAVFAVVSGPEDLAVLWHSQLPFAWPATLERALIVATVGIGAGLAVAGVRRLRHPTVAGQTPPDRTT